VSGKGARTQAAMAHRERWSSDAGGHNASGEGGARVRPVMAHLAEAQLGHDHGASSTVADRRYLQVGLMRTEENGEMKEEKGRGGGLVGCAACFAGMSSTWTNCETRFKLLIPA
jgi:hypothetical protein